MAELCCNQLHLDARHRGNLAELAFMRKAASLGFAVAKPYGEGERYDIIVRIDAVFWRVQVKSVLAKTRSRHHYRVKTSGGGSKRTHRNTPYSASEIDFLAAYIFPEDLWYIFPARILENRRVLCVTPGCARSRFEQYREAWHLMTAANSAQPPAGAAATAVNN